MKADNYCIIWYDMHRYITVYVCVYLFIYLFIFISKNNYIYIGEYMFKKHVEIGQNLWFSIWMGNMKVLPTTSYLASLHIWVVDSTVDGLDHLKLGSSVPNIIKTSKKWSKISSKNTPKTLQKIIKTYFRQNARLLTPAISFPAKKHGHPPSVWHRHGSAEQRHFLTDPMTSMTRWRYMVDDLMPDALCGKSHGKKPLGKSWWYFNSYIYWWWIMVVICGNNSDITNQNDDISWDLFKGFTLRKYYQQQARCLS